MKVFQGTPRARVTIHKLVRNWDLTQDIPERFQFNDLGLESFSFPYPNRENPLPTNPDPTVDLLHVETTKDLGSMVGHFSLGFDARRFPKDSMTQFMKNQWVTWKDLIDQHDLVVIEMGRMPEKSTAGTPYSTVMVGFVDDIYFDRIISSNGVPNYIIRVTGTDLSEILYDARLFWIKSIANVPDALNKILVNLGKLAIQTPTKPANANVEFILKEVLKNLVNFEVNIGESPRSIFDLLGWRLISQDYLQLFPDNLKFGQIQRNVESLLRDAMQWPFHELYTDLRTVDEAAIAIPANLPGAPLINEPAKITFGDDKAGFYFLMRPTPFPWIEKAGDKITEHFEWWDWLKAHASEISEDDEFQDDGDAEADQLTLNRREIRSVYFITPEYASFKGLPAIAKMPFIYNDELINIYGFTPLDITTAIFGSPKMSLEKSSTFGNLWKVLTWQIASWNNPNQYFLSGSKVLKLRPNLKIGTVLLERSPIRGDRYYYIEAVRHVWDFESENSYTELSVTRGLRRTTYDDRANFGKFIGQFLELNENQVGDILETAQKTVHDPPPPNNLFKD